MPRAGLTDSRPGPSYRHPSDKKFASSPPNSASSSPAPSIRGGHHQRQKLSPPLPPVALQAEATTSQHSFRASPAMSTSHPKRIPLPGRRQSKSSTRKVSRPERKASVRKESYDLDEDQEDDDDMDDSDLSDAPSLPGSLPDHSDSDGEMAAKLQAAGDGESLLGSGESGDEQEDDEERYIVAETQARSRPSMKARQRARRAGEDGASASAGAGADDDHDGANATFSDIGGPISPNTMRILGDELLQEQTGFHSDSEPSFTDFFASDDEGLHPADDEGDDEELTSDDDTDSEDQDISDIEGTLMDMGEPFLAHVGAVNGAPQTAEQLQAAMEAGAQIAAQDIPLLVIEDLDGRLIYARAGDGEAVFGSDGEFEFVDESSSEEETDDEDDVPTAPSGMAVDARDPRWAATASQWSRQDSDVLQDDGDTTDELPDEEMPFPRLLVGSVDPRGGRTSRRARALAAQMRRLSPNAPGPSTAGPSAEAGPSTEPSPAPLASPSKPASSTASSSATPVTPSAANARASPDAARPAMGSFMPSSTKSVHRAVIDGSSQAASPFTSKYSLQRRGLAGKRRSRRTSLATGAASSSKRARHDDTSEAPSSPEVSNAPLAMDLDDVVDGSMLWRSSDSSDDEQESDDAASESTTAAGAATDGTRSRTTSMSSAAPSGGFGLNSSAFSRWRRIPMNAFRDQQQQQRGSTAAVERGPAQPVMGGNFLLQRVARNGNNKRDEQQSSPFRRTGSLGSSSLHMVVPSPHAAGDQQRSIVVSPVLWPVRGGPQAQDASTSNIPALPAAVMGTPHGKMTKKEKRERKAKRAAARAAARADKQRLQVDHIFGENEAGGSGMVASAPSTPTVGGTSSLPAPPPASLSPSSAMPRLSLTEASPRASPARDEQQQRSLGTVAAVAAAASHAQPQHLQPHEQHTNDGSTLPGNTPPTRAVAGNGAVPSLPSSTFGGPMTSPLFGGLFAPLNMSAQDEGELEGQGGRGGEALRI